MLNKRAVSDVVFTVLMIMLSISAVAIVAASVLKFVSNTNLSPDESCIPISLNQPIKLVSSCYNTKSGETEITLKRDFRDETFIYSIDFVLDGEKFDCSNSCGNCQVLNAGKTKTYFIPGRKSDLSLNANSCFVAGSKIEDC